MGGLAHLVLVVASGYESCPGFAGPRDLPGRRAMAPSDNETDRLLHDLGERVRNLGIENAALRERLENQGQRSSNRNRVLACSFDIDCRPDLAAREARRNSAQAPRS